MNPIQLHDKIVDQDTELLRLQHLTAKYENAIRRVKDQWESGDDKCWKDLEELFQLLPEGYTIPKRDETCELKFCEQYIRSCHHPGVTYESPQRRIDTLETLLEKIKWLSPMSSRIYQMVDEVLK